MNVCLLLSRILGSKKGPPPTPTYTISGTITGDVVEGVTVALTGDATDSTTTAADGTYSFTGLEDGSYNVEPSLAGYTFTPTDTDVTISGADDTGNDFVSSEITAFYIEDGWEDGVSVPDTSVSGDWSDISLVDPNPITFTNIATPTIATYTPSQSRSLLLSNPNSSGGDGYTFGLIYEGLGNLNIDLSAGLRIMVVAARATTGTCAYTRADINLRNSDKSVFLGCGFENFGADSLWVRENNPTDGNIETYNNSLPNTAETTPIWIALGVEIPASLSGTLKARFYYNANGSGTLYEASHTLSVAYDYSGFTPSGIELIMQKRGDAQAHLCWMWTGRLTDDWPI